MKSPNLFCKEEIADVVPDDIKDYANFGASVLTIMSYFSPNDNYIINDIFKLITSNKYKAVTKEWHKITGSFS